MNIEFLLWFLGALPGEVIFYYAFTKLLKIRNVPLFWMIWVASLTPVVLCRALDAPVPFRLICVFTYQILVPVLLARDRIFRRILVVVLVNIALMLDEAVGLQLWNTLTGLDYAQNMILENQGAHIIVSVIHAAVLAIMLYILYLVMQRAEEPKGDESLRYALGFPIAQFFLLCVLCSLAVYGKIPTNLVFGGASAIAIVFLAVDILYFLYMSRYLKKQHDEQQAEMLQQQVDWCIAQHEGVVTSIESIAQMRHDMRNQIQVVDVLCDRGEYGKAHEHLVELQGRIANVAEEGEGR